MRPIAIFYILFIYILLQFTWWAILLVELQKEKWAMVAGEGMVFLGLLLFGGYRLKKAFDKEIAINKQQKNFLLSVTHELKSPLASIKLYLQTILKRDLDKEKQHSFIESSLEDIERLDDLVENMLLATRIENRSYSFPKEEFNISEMLNSLINRTIKMCQGKRKLIAHIEDHIHYKGDRFALASMVNNLIENAVKYSPSGSEIHIGLQKENDKLVLTVADSGEGIPENEKKKIFEKFYRVCDEAVRTSKGTGLGLFIVKQVADNHHAVINVKNNIPNGTIFEVVFNPTTNFKTI
jgi:two-component system, OmpR family, phosphate regulon sensor histidine kinase PhoR